MCDKYTKAEIENLIDKSGVAETKRLKFYLIDVFSVLPRKIVDRCVKNITFREMDRWGEYCPNYKPLVKLGKDIIRISYETLKLEPKIAKFIFLHEIGHFEKKHLSPMSNWDLRKKQDDEADKFAGQYFSNWKDYFCRDENYELKLKGENESQ